MDNVVANLGEVGQPIRESDALGGRAAWPFGRGTANVDGDFMSRDEALLHDPRPRIRGRDGLHISVRSLMFLRGGFREGISPFVEDDLVQGRNPTSNFNRGEVGFNFNKTNRFYPPLYP